jgi:DNA-binding SARP family transcriptional activator
MGLGKDAMSRYSFDEAVVSGAGDHAMAPRWSWKVELRLIGGFQATRGGVPLELPAGAHRLLAFLALHDGPVPRCFVSGSLWPDLTEGRASGSLRTLLWRLRGNGCTLVESSQGLLGLASTVRVDLHEVTATAKRLLHDPENASPADCRNAGLFGDLLPGWYDPWVLTARELFHHLRLHALEVVCSRMTRLRRHWEAVQAGVAAVSAEPLRESARRVLITAHAAEGNVDAAMRQFDRYRACLDKELGVEPSEEINELITAIRNRAALIEIAS